ncbi:MAG TPA: MFS transporter [Ktedonobacterales bacterium]|nr:MFS transporter [Ktedonobacterales bacterium]
MRIDYLNRFRVLRRNARLYLLSNTLQAITAGAVAVLYTLFLAALGYGTEFIGLVLVVGTIGGGLGILPAAPLVKRLGWRAMLLWSDLIGGIAIAVQLFLPTPPIILVTTLGAGASVAIFLVVNSPFLAANSTPTERTALFGLNNALGYFAAVTGSLLGGFLPAWFALAAVTHSAPLEALRPLLVASPQARAYQLALLATGAISLPSIIPIFMMRDEPPPEHIADETAPSRMPMPNEAPHVPPAPPTIDWRKQVRVWGADALTIGRGVIGRFSLTQALVGLGAGIFLPYINLYIVNTLGASTRFYGSLTAALTVGLAVAGLLSVPLAERFGKVRIAIIAQIASLPFLIALGLFPVIWIVSIAYLIRGFLMNITSPPLQTYLMEAVPARSQVLASEVYNASFQIAFAIGSGVGGLIYVAGARLLFFVAAAFYATSAVLLIAWLGRITGQHRSIPATEQPPQSVA